MKNRKKMPIPDLYDSDHAFDAAYHATDIGALQTKAEAWKRLHKLNPVGGDSSRIHLLVIDDQYDFTFPEGALFVAGRSGKGAMEAQDRLVSFIYENLDILSQITCTMDTHLPFQIFHPCAHVKDDGSHPAPNTVITAEEYRKTVYRPNPAMAKQLNVDPVWLARQFTHYCKELERKGKYSLYLWPYHCLLGANGHQLAGVIDEARLFHTFARGAENRPEIKGGNPLTEHYSIFSPEVTTCWDGQPIPGAQKNTRLIQTLLDADVVIMAGEASSHCVKTSIADFLQDILQQDANMAKKVYILKDCTAAVVIPGVVDFTDEAEKAFQEFQDAGMHVVDSATPIQDWPDLPI